MTGELYGQDLELGLLLRLQARLDDKRVIDVGAERGTFVDAFLAAGATEVYAVEPLPRHAAHLRERYASRPAVRVLEMAIGARDETARLRIATDPSGREYDQYHSLVALPDTAEVRWSRELAVSCRALGSLLADGTLPAHVGVLKIDTEGSDHEAVTGLGRLSAAVIMAEFWDDVPALGKAPYSAADLVEALRPRGYGHFVLVKRHDELQVLQVGSAATRPGDWGNVVFVHDGVWAAVAPTVYDAAVEAQTALVDRALEFRWHCQERLKTIDALRARRGVRGLVRAVAGRLRGLRDQVTRRTHPPGQ